MEAMMTATKKVSGPAAGYHRCPVCKRVMLAVDNSREDGFLFVWYACRDVHCDGQWLDKKPLYGKNA